MCVRVSAWLNVPLNVAVQGPTLLPGVVGGGGGGRGAAPQQHRRAQVRAVRRHQARVRRGEPDLPKATAVVVGTTEVQEARS